MPDLKEIPASLPASPITPISAEFLDEEIDIEEVKKMLKDIRYPRQNTTFSIYYSFFGQLVLNAYFNDVIDATQPGNKETLTVSIVLPEKFSRRYLLFAVSDLVKKIETHEVDEFLKYKGICIIKPHNGISSML